MIGASPEMFVRCEKTNQGLRVETCPISGTIARGENALQDAQRIKEILANPKEESELTMCTDVDRNDKSRICVPGSVKVLGRRQIEMYVSFALALSLSRCLSPPPLPLSFLFCLK